MVFGAVVVFHLQMLFQILHTWSSHPTEVWFKFFTWGRLYETPYSLGTDNSQTPMGCQEGDVEASKLSAH